MAVIKSVKSSKGDRKWKQMSTSVKRRPKAEPCVFYTPLGRMVSYPAGTRPSHMNPDEWCAMKTPFKNQVLKRK
ncbi:hypothetical protein [uncultured virus]|uniref:Uncharacterized protein n=1 Tax=uncultured virus TaxID=340016 RepID=A0A218MKG0_9VIRU|nr:hypothetical protein [uncultured virus]|tara:strand:+ start:350 stop:571 length:222 start_codon:yes stop_codon:yes gene_type:complete